MKILEYIDCMHLDDIVRLGAKPLPGDIDGSPSACIGQCENSQLFGVSNSKCFCLKQKSIKFRKTSMKTKCTTQCQYPRGVVCGFENDTDTYLSVYKLNENVLARSFKESTLEAEKENHCLAFNLAKRNFIWKNCKHAFKHLCYTDHEVVKIPNMSTWSDAANYCFAIKSVPASINNPVTVENDDIEYLWTGVIRLNIVYKIDNYYKDENNEEIKYGVLSKEPSGRYLLTFENVRDRRRSLCHKRLQGSKILSIVPVLIAVAIAIFIIGVVAIACRIMVKYKRRLRKAKKQVVRTSESDKHYEESSFTLESTEEHPCHQYFVVEPHEKKVTTPANTYNKPFRLNGIARGATITNGSQMHMNGTDNQQYNTLSSCKVGKSMENDVVYNKLDVKNERSAKYTDNVYDSFKGHQLDKTELSDVEYNRLDAKIRGNMHTDNVYNSFADKGKQRRFEYDKLDVRKDGGKKHTDGSYDSSGQRENRKREQIGVEYNRLEVRK
ncbi:uncharacterized protein LOC132732202 isoform X2 [Ruditapes philippinarum]|nr:uncharacterized protein LOC132732202 isoform X2 [Ruditapes philippinarum]XP_060574576.1 uncharacterized protein LOC132732202 isoform X2 [Ruditapes philippinarum]